VTGDFTSAPLRAADPWTGARLQQGRVLLDGDWNLNLDAAARDRQRLALETIGPAGVIQGSTGFEISFAADGTLQIGAGAMWVGGLYAVNPASLAYAAQETIAALPESGQALVYLDAFVQEIQSAEDPADLLDPALDGIDTTTRTRVAWRVRAVPVSTASCADAAAALPPELISTGQLDIAPTTPATVADPCAPPDDPRGKLPDGLLRVEVLDAGTADQARFAWSYENGSGAVAATVAGTRVTLAPSPSVTFYQNDLVEVSTLQRRADRQPNGPLLTVAHVGPGAAGSVVTLSEASTVTGTPSGLCLRRWDGQVIGAATPVAATLAGTDVGVAFTARPGDYLAGDWWVTQVRGSSGNSVQALAAAPPDGMQHYVAPLAVVDLAAKTVLSDCRPQFPPLTQVRGGCCTLEVQPSDGPVLPALLAGYANRGPVTVCLAPGTYELSEPLVIGPGLTGLTLQGCSPGVVLKAPGTPGPQFTLGLIVVQEANSVTVKDIELSVPLTGLMPAADAFASLPPTNRALLQAYANGLQVVIGLSASNSTGLTVEKCTFTFPDLGRANTFGAGIYVSGAMDDVEVTRCTFTSASPPIITPFRDLAAGTQVEPPYQLTFGYLQVATPDGGAGSSQLLQDLTVERCQFQGVTVPLLALTQLGTLRIDQNTVRDSYGGFWFYNLPSPSQLVLFDQVAIGNPQSYLFLCTIGLAAIGDRVVPMTTALARVLPTTPPVSGAEVSRLIGAPSAAEFARARQTFTNMLTQARGATVRPAPAAAAPTGQAPASDAAAGTDSADAAPTAPISATADAEKTQEMKVMGPAAKAGAAADAEMQAVIGVTFRPVGGLTVEPAIPLADTGISVSPRLDMCDCQVDAVIAESYSGAALILVDLAETASTTSAVIHGNRLRCRFPGGETAMSLWLAQACVTGNIVANEVAIPTQPSSTMLSSHSMTMLAPVQLFGALAVAISDNVFIDPVGVPTPDPATLNTIINYNVVPTVTGLSPANGPVGGGGTVTVTGTGFTSATAVNFGANTATNMAIQSDTQLTVTFPAGTGTVDVIVTTQAGTSATGPADQFSYFVLRAEG
jgi:hypothetical protein